MYEHRNAVVISMQSFCASGLPTMVAGDSFLFERHTFLSAEYAYTYILCQQSGLEIDFKSILHFIISIVFEEVLLQYGHSEK